MDPSTTLITFMLQTHPSVQSVRLLGSWDSFSRYYIMDRDVRRDRGQWKGCWSFRDIVCDDDFGVRAGAKRNGGLKMGHTYYYYYELDGSFETHDPSLPSTTACPYLPGQTVNTLFVPVEQRLRKRSASLSSMRGRDFRTMNPHDKYVAPQAVPEAHRQLLSPNGLPRVGSSPQFISNRDISTPSSSSCSSNNMNNGRTASPATWKRLLGLKSSHSREDSRGRSFQTVDLDTRSASPVSLRSAQQADDVRSVVSSEGTRTRDISPESLRRFLSEDVLPMQHYGPAPAALEEKLAVLIPEDIAEEEVEDDELNFASSATENPAPYATCLSPPPFKRTHSSHSNASLSSTLSTAPVVATTNDSSMTLTAHLPENQPEEEPIPTLPPTLPTLDFSLPRSRFSISTIGSDLNDDVDDDHLDLDLASPTSPDDEVPSFYDSANEDDDILSSIGDEGVRSPFQPLSLPSTRKQSIDMSNQYSLPAAGGEATKSLQVPAGYASLGSPALLARTDAGLPVGNTSLLAAPVDNGLDDLVNELGWMVDVIRGKH